MKYVVAVLGLLIGIVLGVALLMLNPLLWTRPELRALSGPVRTLAWQPAARIAGVELTPRTLLGRDSATGTARAFTEPGIRFARAEVVALTGNDGAAQALGVRLSANAATNALLKAQLGVVADWNILWPGAGSMLLAGSEDFWRPWRDGLSHAVRGREFAPAEAYVLQPVPGTGQPAVIAGTGTLAKISGGYRERFWPVADRPWDFVGRREIDLPIE